MRKKEPGDEHETRKCDLVRKHWKAPDYALTLEFLGRWFVSCNSGPSLGGWGAPLLSFPPIPCSSHPRTAARPKFPSQGSLPVKDALICVPRALGPSPSSPSSQLLCCLSFFSLPPDGKFLRDRTVTFFPTSPCPSIQCLLHTGPP